VKTFETTEVVEAMPSPAHRRWLRQLAEVAASLEEESGHLREGWREFKKRDSWTVAPCNWWACQVRRDGAVALSIDEGAEQIRRHGHFDCGIRAPGHFRGGRFGRTYSERIVVSPDGVDIESDQAALRHSFALHLKHNCGSAPDPVMCRSLGKQLQRWGFCPSQFGSLDEAVSYCRKLVAEERVAAAVRIAELDWELVRDLE